MTVWDALIGQPEAVRVLRRAALAGRDIVGERSDEPNRRLAAQNGTDFASEDKDLRSALTHAWLITGPPGSGRSVAARALAAALQCTGDPVGCGQCPGCRTTLQGSNVDVRQYATDLRIIPVKDVREMVQLSYDAPNGRKWRITIIEDADRIRDESVVTLLKSIEEPPERGIWILCAPTVDTLIPTIRSRCRHIGLRTPSADAVGQYLAETEGVDFEQARIAAVLAQSHVGVAKALLRNPELRDERRRSVEILLDANSVGTAVVAAARMHKEATAQAKAHTDSLNRAEKDKLLRSLGVLEGKRVPPALRAQVKAMEDDQVRREKRGLHDALDRGLLDLLGFYRDVLAVQLGSNAEFIHIDMEERIRSVAANSTPEMTVARTKAVREAREHLHTNAAPLLVIEAMTVSLVNPLT